MTEIFAYEFMRHAFLAGTMAAILAGIVGYFVILRKLAFAAHALGHIGFAGASGALLAGLSPMTGQLLLTVLAAIGIGSLGERAHKSDMIIGIILSFCLGLGTLFLHFYNGYAGQASIILFGNLLGVSDQDISLMTWLMTASLIGIGILARRLIFSSIEPEMAEAKGISLYWMSVFFVVILSMAVTLASQVVGVILVFTLLIGPAAIAVQCTHHTWAGIMLSVALAILVVWMGIVLTFFTDWPISFWITALVFLLYLPTAFKRTAD
ncbi:metal ABC transporter permease [Aquicella siphonis]|nr:metal ABC transporter permease [Aquicella siphonis]